MTSDYEDYCADVINSSGVITTARHCMLALEMLAELWNNDVVVEYVWAMSCDFDGVIMYAVAIDSNDLECEAICRWKYDEADRKSATWPAKPLVMVDLELRDLEDGIVDNDN